MMRSFVGSSVCHFLSNLHPFEHKIFLARHGERHLADICCGFFGPIRSHKFMDANKLLCKQHPQNSSLEMIFLPSPSWPGEFNVEMRIGGDSGLSPRGEEFARRTAEFATELKKSSFPFRLCVSVATYLTITCC